MIDRIVHHADVLTLKGASYRLRGRGIDSLPSIRTTTDRNRVLDCPTTVHFSSAETDQFSSAVDTIPTGTVTMLFSDIEGSTALLSPLGPSYADALDGPRPPC